VPFALLCRLPPCPGQGPPVDGADARASWQAGAYALRSTRCGGSGYVSVCMCTCCRHACVAVQTDLRWKLTKWELEEKAEETRKEAAAMTMTQRPSAGPAC
jgi:hypothetical protein